MIIITLNLYKITTVSRKYKKLIILTIGDTYYKIYLKHTKINRNIHLKKINVNLWHMHLILSNIMWYSYSYYYLNNNNITSILASNTYKTKT